MHKTLTDLPLDTPLLRKHVCLYLQWSRTTLWRRERAGLRFADQAITVGELLEWLRTHGRPFNPGDARWLDYADSQIPPGSSTDAPLAEPALADFP